MPSQYRLGAFSDTTYPEISDWVSNGRRGMPPVGGGRGRPPVAGSSTPVAGSSPPVAGAWPQLAGDAPPGLDGSEAASVKRIQLLSSDTVRGLELPDIYLNLVGAGLGPKLSGIKLSQTGSTDG